MHTLLAFDVSYRCSRCHYFLSYFPVMRKSHAPTKQPKCMINGEMPDYQL